VREREKDPLHVLRRRFIRVATQVQCISLVTLSLKVYEQSDIDRHKV